MKTSMVFSIFLMLAMSGCSTMFNSSSQSIRVNGNEGMAVLITTPDGTYSSKLPTTVVADPSWSDVTIKADDKRYEPSSSTVKKSITPSFWANIFNSGIGAVVDLATGKLWKYDNNVQVVAAQKVN